MDVFARGTGRTPRCPSCAQPMRLVRTTERFGDLPSVQTFDCVACGISFTHQTTSVTTAYPASSRSPRATALDEHKLRRF